MSIRAKRTDARGNVAETVTVYARRYSDGDNDVVLLDFQGDRVTKQYDLSLDDAAAMCREIFPERWPEGGNGD